MGYSVSRVEVAPQLRKIYIVIDLEISAKKGHSGTWFK